MPEKVAQPLSLPAIFYDIIFSYIIGRLARALLFTNHGNLDFRSGFAFGIMMLCAWTVWTYQVIYASRAPARPLIDAGFLTLSGFLSLYLTSSLGLWQTLPLTSTKLATAGLFLLLAIQYRGFDGQSGDTRALRLPLLLAGICSLIALFPGQSGIGNGVYVLAVLIAAIGPWTHFHHRPHTTSHFKTISQRLALFTALLFGRAIIEATDSFADLSPQPLLFFGAMILLFAGYVLVMTTGIDKETTRSSTLALLLHLPLVASVLMMAGITRMALAGRLLPEHFALWMLSLIAIYTLVLGTLLALYHRPGVALDSRRVFFYGVSLGILALYGLVTVTMGALFLLGTCAYLIASVLYLWQFVLNAEGNEW